MKPNDLPIVSKTVTNLLKMRQAWLDKPDNLCDMYHWAGVEACGTTHCLLGTYVAAYGDETGLEFTPQGLVVPLRKAVFDDPTPTEIACFAAEEIGISAYDARILFLPDLYAHQGRVTKEQVTQRLDEMIVKYSK